MSFARIQKCAFVGAMCLIVALCAILFAVPHDTARAYDSYYGDADGFADEVFTSLEYGLYWYDDTSVIPKKAGTAGANFDPDKPTIIFTHGMKIDEGYNRRDLVSLWGGTPSQFETAGYDEYMYSDQYYKTLLDLGYNVGHFYWNQLAEISFEQDYRIWTSDIAGGLNYFVVNGSGSRVQGDTSKNPQTSVAMLFTDAILSGLGADYSQPWRLVGHSMGGQLVVATTQSLVYKQKQGDIGKNLVPERISLIDPYLCNTALSEGMRIDHLGHKPVEAGTWTAELAGAAMEEIADYGVAIDAYGGTQMVYRNFLVRSEMEIVAEYGDESEEYRANSARITALVEQLSNAACWTHLSAIAKKFGAISHCMIIDYYFTTMYEEDQTDNFGVTLPSCLSSTEYIRNLRGLSFLQASKGDVDFYRHTTNFERCTNLRKTVKEEQAGIVTGTAAGATKVELLNAQGEVVQAVVPTSAGEYHFFGLDQGTYTVRIDTADKDKVVEVATGALVVLQSEAAVETNASYIFWIVVAVPVVLLIVMVIVIAVTASAKKKVQA